VRRLGSHASLAIWGGNNEIETSFGWYSATRERPHLYAADYQVLFLDTVRRVIHEVGGSWGRQAGRQAEAGSRL
jgi:beta-mannosidase